MEDPGAAYCVMLHDPTLRRTLVATMRERQSRGRPGWPGAGGRVLRHSLAALLHACATRLEPKPRSAFAQPAGARP